MKNWSLIAVKNSAAPDIHVNRDNHSNSGY